MTARRSQELSAASCAGRCAARYRGHEIVSMPPSSSGGVVLIEMLNILEGYKLGELDEPSRLHLMIEAMRRAYADRAAYLGDPAVVTRAARAADVEALCRDSCAPASTPSAPRPRTRSATTSRCRARATTPRISRWSTATATRSPTPIRSISAMASAWSPRAPACCSTTSSTILPRKPATPNAYGLIGGDANAPGPGKRPLSSMTPTIVLKNGRPVIVTGSPGGSRIITAVLQILVNVIDRNMDARRGGRGAAHPSSMVAGPGARRERAAGRPGRRARSARPQGRAAPVRAPRPTRSW